MRPRVTSSSELGDDSGNHGSGGSCGDGCAVVSCSSVMIAVPRRTSIAAWCSLGQQREAVLRQVEQAVEALDDVQLPQRPVEVERARVDARGLNAELAPVARLRQRDVAHVILEVEVLVLDPVRLVEPERHGAQLLPEHRRAVQPALHEREDAFEREPAAGRGRRVVDRDEADVRIGVGALGGEEERIVLAELTHGAVSCCGALRGAGRRWRRANSYFFFRPSSSLRKDFSALETVFSGPVSLKKTLPPGPSTMAPSSR